MAALIGLAFVVVITAMLTASQTIVAQGMMLRAIPKAECGPTDRKESVQGRTTLAERFAPGPARAFNCNLELIGRTGEGSAWGMNVFDTCAYYSTAPIRADGPSQPGVPVLDVADSRNPKLTKILQSRAALDANESLEMSQSRKLMLAAVSLGAAYPVDLYDVSDCRNPVLLSSTDLPEFQTHGGAFSPDGTVYFGVPCCGRGPNSSPGPVSAVFAIDVKDPKKPQEIARWIPEEKNLQTHWLTINPEGTRAYITPIRLNPKTNYLEGLIILDISDFSARKPNPKFRVISKTFWDDITFGEFGAPFQQRGRRYFVHTAMTGTFPFAGGVNDPTACKGRPGWGHARILDINDEQKPSTVSRLLLDVHLPANCASIAYDPVGMGGYSPAFCDVDNALDAKLMACGHMDGGLRVFDIRQVTQPREIAYYKPPATGGALRAASFIRPDVGLPAYTADPVVVPKFRDNGKEIWFNSMLNGFHVVRFSGRFIAANPGLFQK